MCSIPNENEPIPPRDPVVERFMIDKRIVDELVRGGMPNDSPQSLSRGPFIQQLINILGVRWRCPHILRWAVILLDCQPPWMQKCDDVLGVPTS